MAVKIWSSVSRSKVMSTIGELVVNLRAQTAEFFDSMGHAKQDLTEFGEQGGEAGHRMESSMREARGGLMMTEHILGVPLPRHLNTLIAQIPGVGAAFAPMLPIIGVVLAITIIAKLIEKPLEHEEAIRKTKIAFLDM